MSASSMPWSIKGVSAEARGIAKSEAERTGQAIGPWLNRLIRAASEVERQAADGAAAGTTGAAPAPAALPVPDMPRLPAIEWRQEIESLTQRIGTLEARAAALVGPLDQAVERIARRLDAIEARRLEQQGA
jgi:hypothetical protein